MTTTYRVEAHDGNRWGFGIRISSNSKEAARLCGGSLRVARVQDA